MKFILSVIVLVFLNTSIWACMCPDLRFGIPSIEKLPEYDFIGHISIVQDGEEWKNEGVLKIEVLELFQGEKIDSIIEYDRYSSCDLGIGQGEEWIVFANKNDLGQVVLGACAYVLKYKKADGQRFGFGYTSSLNKLRKIYDHKTSQPINFNGKNETFYKNGTLEFQVFFKDSLLEGTRRIWYPNGQLMSEGHFKRDHKDGQFLEYYSNGQLKSLRIYKDDKREGKHLEYFETGQLEEENHYLNDHHIQISRRYYDTTYSHYMERMLVREYGSLEAVKLVYGRIQVKREVIHDENGNTLIIREYYRSGNIKMEINGSPHSEIRTFIYYRKNGNISEITYQKNKKYHGRYQRFDKNGLPSRHWYYDKDGKRIKED